MSLRQFFFFFSWSGWLYGCSLYTSYAADDKGGVVLVVRHILTQNNKKE